MFVESPDNPDWGLGQVQSRVGDMVTVNFTETGKQVVNAAVIPLQVVWSVDKDHRAT
jgi:hypothetical protein